MTRGPHSTSLRLVSLRPTLLGSIQLALLFALRITTSCACESLRENSHEPPCLPFYHRCNCRCLNPSVSDGRGPRKQSHPVPDRLHDFALFAVPPRSGHSR